MKKFKKDLVSSSQYHNPKVSHVKVFNLDIINLLTVKHQQYNKAADNLKPAKMSESSAPSERILSTFLSFQGGLIKRSSAKDLVTSSGEVADC